MEKQAADARSQRRAATARLIQAAGAQPNQPNTPAENPQKDYTDARPKRDMQRRFHAKVAMAQ